MRTRDLGLPTTIEEFVSQNEKDFIVSVASTAIELWTGLYQSRGWRKWGK